MTRTAMLHLGIGTLSRRRIYLGVALVLLGTLVGGVVWAPAASAQTPAAPYPWQYYQAGYAGYPIDGYESPQSGCQFGCSIGNGYPSPSFPYNALGANEQYPAGAYDPYFYNYYGYGYPVGYSYNQGYIYTGGELAAPSSTPTQAPGPAVPIYSVSGQYCLDSSGGMVWVPTGAPTTGLTCKTAGS